MSNPTAHNEDDLVRLGLEKEGEWEDEDELDAVIERETLQAAGGQAAEGKTLRGPSRHQYTREYKLRAIRYAQRYTVGPWIDNTGGVCKPLSRYKVAQKFRITPTMLRKWIRNADSILEQRIGQRRNTKGHKALLPEMELALFQQFIALREKCCKVKVNWFLLTARKLFEEYYPQQVIIDEKGHREYEIS